MKQIIENGVQEEVLALNGLQDTVVDEPPLESAVKDEKAQLGSCANVVLYRSILNDFPMFITFLLGTLVVSWLTFSFKDTLSVYFRYDPLVVLGLVGVVAFAFMGLVSVYRRSDVKYLISDDGIQARRGFLSNHQIDAKLEYYQIRGTEIHRSLFERLIGTGNLLIRGSGSADNNREIAFKGISDPLRYQKLIQSRHRLEVQGSKAAWMNNSDISPVEENSRQ